MIFCAQREENAQPRQPGTPSAGTTVRRNAQMKTRNRQQSGINFQQGKNTALDRAGAESLGLHRENGQPAPSRLPAHPGGTRFSLYPVSRSPPGEHTRPEPWGVTARAGRHAHLRLEK